MINRLVGVYTDIRCIINRIKIDIGWICNVTIAKIILLYMVLSIFLKCVIWDENRNIKLVIGNGYEKM